MRSHSNEHPRGKVFAVGSATNASALSAATRPPTILAESWERVGREWQYRYLVSTEDWLLLVWRICDHDEYDRLLNQGRKTDAGARVAAERRAQYEPFVRMDLYEFSSR